MKLKSNIIHVLFCCFLWAPVIVSAHEMRPALLQIKQTGNNEYELLWKIPRLNDKVISIKPVFPEWFKVEQKNLAAESGSGALYTFLATSSKDIHGMTFSIKGLEESMVDVLVEVELKNGEQYSMMLQPGKKSGKIPYSTSAMDTIKTYISLGVKHIWSGIDHLLFVLALLIITLWNTRKLLVTVTAFTIAHSITLSLAALGYVGLPGPPVEATIALSIVFLAVEIIRGQQGVPTLTSKKPWLVAFTFGLLHGLGFASALVAVGLPQQHIPLALGFFNVGVEIGQIAFIIVVLQILKLLSMVKVAWPVWGLKMPAYIIGTVASFWLFERVAAFWN